MPRKTTHSYCGSSGVSVVEVVCSSSGSSGVSVVAVVCSSSGSSDNCRGSGSSQPLLMI